ncbi:MAG: glycosyltransferase family 1 protein [Clostridia bacterium]|nr:glycosyltransferase family 1 protein [Clostridia bacterium]
MAEPIRILHVVQRMEAGGTQALLMNLYRNIDRSKVQFDFLVEYEDKEFYDDEILSLGGKIYYTNLRKDFNILKFKKKLKEILNGEYKYKIMHVHAFTIGFFCLQTAKKCGVPVRIAHSHNNETVHDAKYFLKRIMQKIYPIYATDLFACSNEAGKYLFGKKEFNVLTNAIDAKKFIFNSENRDKIRKELNIENSFVVGHVGRLHPQKNHEYLLKVFSELKKEKENAKLLLIGNGPLEEQIQEKVESLGLKDDVLFLKNRKDMNVIYQGMDVFVFPSLFEGLGIVAIEAQASGTPVVCSDRLPPETEVTSIYKRLSLDDAPEIWAKECLDIVKLDKCKTNLLSDIIKSGFDLSSTVNELQEYYLKKEGQYSE